MKNELEKIGLEHSETGGRASQLVLFFVWEFFGRLEHSETRGPAFQLSLFFVWEFFGRLEHSQTRPPATHLLSFSILFLYENFYYSL
jgi:hypothetical protein